MAEKREDWFAIVEAIERDDRMALLKLTRVITGFLARYGAYQQRDSWDDLTQDVLVSLLRSVRDGRVREREAFINYTGRITRNKLVDSLRASKTAGAVELADDLEADQLSVDAKAQQSEPRRPDELMDLRKAVTALGEQERRVIESVYLEGRSYQEAADRLELPLGTLKRLQTKGLRVLREKMGIAPNG